MKYAQIAFLQKTNLENNILTYEIPKSMKIEIGQSVLIPMRKQIKTGIVWETHNNKPIFKTLPIKEILNPIPLLNNSQIKLIKWVKNYYFCPLHKILKLFIPKRILENKPFKKQAKPFEQKNNTKTIKKLTKDQEKAINQIQKSLKNKFLIHGVTGSGKTEIYTNLAKKYIQKNKQVLILVPEISLTPQTIEYFENSLEIKASVIHSKISEGEKYQTWENIFQNKSKLIIGSRSAIFAPFQELSLIIIDEEHELSYKQESSPRYKIHSIIDKLQEINPKIKAVYGSATPSIEITEQLQKNTIKLTKRIGDFSMPEVHIIDLREEFKKQNKSIFSELLHKDLENILNSKQQAILFLNRRGSASSVVCRDCGFTSKCNECDIPLTFHLKTYKNPSLICHHCGKIFPHPSSCPFCKGLNIKFLGIGTQKIEEETKKLFPNAKILRADKDTTSKKQDFKNIYKDFKAHKADILIGTQMIAKGLHLPKVNLVGVILADIGLNIPDFRSTEKNFQLMTQVTGRSGRSGNNGKVIIQTYNPENIALLCTKEHNYKKFFTYERTQRKILNNPPFGKLSKILIENTSEKICINEIKNIENLLLDIIKKLKLENEIEVQTYPAYLFKIKGKYRYILLIKSKSKKINPQSLIAKLPKKYIIDTNIKIDTDPSSIT